MLRDGESLGVEQIRSAVEGFIGLGARAERGRPNATQLAQYGTRMGSGQYLRSLHDSKAPLE